RPREGKAAQHHRERTWRHEQSLNRADQLVAREALAGGEPLRRHSRDHGGEAAAQPEREAQNVHQEPESSHVYPRTTSGTGCRPAYPASSACQCSILSSPIFQHQKISLPSSLPYKSTSPWSNPLTP